MLRSGTGIKSFSIQLEQKDEILLDFLKQLNTETSSEIINLIKGIIIIDLSDNNLTAAHYNSFLGSPLYEEYTSKWPFSKKEKYYKLFSTIKIFCGKKLGINSHAISRAKNFLPVNIQKLHSEALSKYSGDEQLIILPHLLSPILKIIIRKLDNVKGYKRTDFKWKKKILKYHTEIDDLNDYLKFTSKLTKEIKQESLTRIPDFSTRFFDFFVTNQFEQNSFHNKYSNFLHGTTSKIILFGNDDYLSKRFILEIQKELGGFHIHDCSHGDYEITPGQTKLIFRNITKLSQSQLNSFSAEIFKTKHSNKIIIIQTNTIPEVLNYFNFEIIYLPEYNQIKPLLGRIFFYLANEKKLMNVDLDNMLIRVMANSKTVISVLSKIPSLNELERILEKDLQSNLPLENFNFLIEGFWYDFRKFVEYKYQNKDQIDIPATDRIITIEYDKISQEWVISASFLFQEPRRFPYSRSLAVMCITYLAKYCQFPKSIKVENLNKVTKNWQNEAKKEKNNTFNKKPNYTSGNIYENVRDFLSKNGLSILFDETIIKIDKNICFYNPNGHGNPLYIINKHDKIPREFIT